VREGCKHFKGRSVKIRRLQPSYQAYQAYYQGQSEHDLVVPLASAMEANKPNSGYEPTRTTCDHFSYFSDEVCGAGAIETAIRLLWDCFGLVDSVRQAMEAEERKQPSVATPSPLPQRKQTPPILPPHLRGHRKFK
jgi:hypothetical protein